MKNNMDYIRKFSSPLGELTISSDGSNITGLWLEGQKYFAATIDEISAKESDLPVFEIAGKWLDLYFSGQEPDFLPPLAPKGTDFRQSVWKILCQIPYGKVITYGDIAKQLGAQTNSNGSARAVGGAVGHNPISIIIPCHRVIGANGNLTGFAGGIDKKIQLLTLEGYL